MKALVATLNHILFVDIHRHSVDVVEMHRGDYYGISWWEDSQYPVMSHSVLRGENLYTLEDYATSEVGYLSYGKEERSPAFLSNPHQILCAKNGWIVTTNTGRNRVTVYNPTNGFYKDLRANDILWDRMGVNNLCGEHFNSVYIRDNRLYVLAHGFNKYSYVLEYSFPECEPIKKHDIKYRTGLHNIWVDASGNMLTCHSASGELLEIKTNEVIWRGSAFYSRGLAVSSDLIIIGDTEIAMREDRKHSQCGLWLIDRRSLKTIDYITLGPYGSCHEIRLLDVPDEAHHGIPFKNTEVFQFLDPSETKIRQEVNGLPFLRKRRQNKLDHQKSYSKNTFTSTADFIIGNLDLHEGWMTPRNEQIHQRCVIAVAKKQPKDNFRLSLDYAFFDSETLEEQHLSLILGYKGSGDNNMVAVFLHFTREKYCYLYLMKNNNGAWTDADVLITETMPNQGKLEITRLENQLQIICNDKQAERTLEAHELVGNVGIRCQGSHFKNFSVIEM
jgi:hypothetical protein